MGAIAKANRNEHYYAILGDLPKQRALVLEAISDSGEHGITRHELAEKLHRPISSMCARVHELEEAGFITETGEERETQYGGSATVLKLSGRFVSNALVQKTFF